MDFTIYSAATGKILRAGFCPEADIDAQAGEGEAVWPGERLDDTQWKISGGAKVAIAADPAEAEAEVLSAIDWSAENIRALFVTNTASQAGVYLVKEAEARALIADPGLAENETPHVTMEAARLGAARSVVAAAIIAKADEWRAVSAAIEAIRLGAKDAARAATTAAAKRAVLSALDWSAVTAMV